MGFYKKCLTGAIPAVALALAAFTTVAVRAETIDFVPVYDAGDADEETGFGQVDQWYRIGKYEVTNTQYVEFLNAVAKDEDTHGLYNIAMGSGRGGIKRSGFPGAWSYTAKSGYEEMPVNYVSLFDAYRFINWLENGQPGVGSGVAQDATSTEDGAYTFGPTGAASLNAEAMYRVPTEDQWYKAAYHDPNQGGAGVGGYWDFATQSDAPPTSESPDDVPAGGRANGSANYLDTDGYAVGWQRYTSDVGAYTTTTSAYGTHDQNGNIDEWTDTQDGAHNVVRGGSYETDLTFLMAGQFVTTTPTSEGPAVGFRIVSKPEDQPVAPTLDPIYPENTQEGTPFVAVAFGADAGVLLIDTIQAHDEDLITGFGESLTFSIQPNTAQNANPYPPGLPEGLASIGSQFIQKTGEDTATFSWDPRVLDRATTLMGDQYDVVVRVEDVYGNSAERVLTLEIVPEPSTVLMMVSMGVMGLLVWWRRRSKV